MRRALAVYVTVWCALCFRAKTEIWYSSSTVVDKNATAGFFQGALEQAGNHVRRSKPQLILYVGILTSVHTLHRRQMQRKAFCDAAQVPNTSRCEFMLGTDEKLVQTEAEAQLHGDLVFLNVSTDYLYSSYKVLYAFAHALARFRFQFFLKLDDDTWVDVPRLVETVPRDYCLNKRCHRSRLYLGHEVIRGNPTMPSLNDSFGPAALARGWVAPDMTQALGIKQHPAYFTGGAYLVSQDAVRAVVSMHQTVGLRWHRLEDTNVGLWLAPLNLRFVEHPGFFIRPTLCSADISQSCESLNYLEAGFYDMVEARMCNETHPWMALHKIESQDMMDYLLRRFAQCKKATNGSSLA